MEKILGEKKPKNRKLQIKNTLQGYDSKLKKKYLYTVDRLFRDYDSLADCLADHTRILQKPGYADAWPYRHNAEVFARKIADGVGCKYATDPLYATTITKLIRQVRRIVEKGGQ